jgi:molybdopterin/thiamine biosynthesis adenylyltransferase
MFGSLQAAEAIKYVVGKGGLLTDRLLFCDLFEMIFREVKIRKRPQCPACGKGGRP